MYDYEIEKRFTKEEPFIGVFPCDKIPAKIKNVPCGFIINTDKAKDPGTHWVSVNVLNDMYGEYFDSFGLPPMQKEIIDFLQKNCTNGWYYNAVTLQHPLTSSCGEYCIAFLKNRFNNVSFQSFLKKFCFNIDHNEKILFNSLKK